MLRTSVMKKVIQAENDTKERFGDLERENNYRESQKGVDEDTVRVLFW